MRWTVPKPYPYCHGVFDPGVQEALALLVASVDMSKAQLVALAAKYNVDITACKNSRQRTEAINEAVSNSSTSS